MSARFFTLALLASTGLYACSDEPAPSTPTANESSPNGVAAEPIMNFTPKLQNAGLEEHGGPLGLIFGAGTVDPFDANNSARQVLRIDMKVKSDSVDTASYKNFLRARFTVTLRKGTETVASREFESDGFVVLQNNDDQDTMTGAFRDRNDGSTRLNISATRTASGNEAAAAKNPWQGSLHWTDATNRDIDLGPLEGYFSGLLND